MGGTDCRIAGVGELSQTGGKRCEGAESDWRKKVCGRKVRLEERGVGELSETGGKRCAGGKSDWRKEV